MASTDRSTAAETAQKFLLALFATGAVGTFASAPFDRIRTLLQLQVCSIAFRALETEKRSKRPSVAQLK